MEIQGRGANSSCCCGCVHARKSAGSKCSTWRKVSCPDSVFSRKSEMKAAPNPLSGQCRPWGTWVHAARSWRWMQHAALPAEHQPALFVTSASHRTDFALSWTVFQWKRNSSQETFDATLKVISAIAHHPFCGPALWKPAALMLRPGRQRTTLCSYRDGNVCLHL